MNSRYPSLAQMFSSYLHQNWSCDYASPHHSIQEFVDWESWIAVHDALQELTHFMQTCVDDEEAARALSALGCHYDPRAEGLTVHEWLLEVRSKLEEACL